MTPIRELYPEWQEEDYDSHPWDYTPLLASIGPILLKVDDGRYEGDSYVIYADGERRGYLTFGWGSCSGCDSLQACDDAAAVERLRAELAESIQWFATPAALDQYFRAADFEAKWYGRQAVFEAFKAAVLELAPGAGEEG